MHAQPAGFLRDEWAGTRSGSSGWLGRCWNKLAAGLSPHSLLGGTFKVATVANVAAGLGCGRTNVWAAELRAALQFACRPTLAGQRT